MSQPRKKRKYRGKPEIKRDSPGKQKSFRGLRIIYEDQWIICVFKPAGVLAHKDITGDPDLLLTTKQYLQSEQRHRTLPFLGLVHRLDRPASGVIVFAKTPDAARHLSDQFKQRTVEKIYLAVVHGIPQPQETLTDHVAKDSETRTARIEKASSDNAKYAELRYSVMETRGKRSLLRIALKTGRSHQIRIQLGSRGFPVVGDRKYGSREVLKNPGMIALCAFAMTFEHPSSQRRITVTSPRPDHWPWYDPALFKPQK